MSKSTNTIGKKKRDDAIAFFGHTEPKDKITLDTKTTKRKVKDSVLESLENDENKQIKKLYEKYPTRASEIARNNKLLDTETKRRQIIDFIKREGVKTNIDIIYKFILEKFDS